MRREGYEVVADWGEITYSYSWICFLLKEVAFFDGRRALMEERDKRGERDEGDDMSVLQM